MNDVQTVNIDEMRVERPQARQKKKEMVYEARLGCKCFKIDWRQPHVAGLWCPIHV